MTINPRGGTMRKEERNAVERKEEKQMLMNYQLKAKRAVLERRLTEA